MVKEQNITVMNNATLVVEDIKKYFDARGLIRPGLGDSLEFLATEVGECFDLKLQEQGGFVRNDKNKERKLSLAEFQSKMGRELGDVIMMAIVAGMAIGIDPIQSLQTKMAEKLAEMKEN